MYKSEQNVSGDTLFEEGLQLDNIRLLEGVDWSAVEYQTSMLLHEDINLENQEETMDAATKYSLMMPLEFKPVSPKGPPERENFTGDLKFEIEISGSDTNRSKFMYSHRLNRIYVFMGHGFSVQLKWDVTAQPFAAMFVRATPVFSDKAQAEKRVVRCIQHYHETKNDPSMCESMRSCVLHSTRAAGTADVWYCGAESPDVWYSVLVRFPAPSAHAYQFACKNSCSSGINRRTIGIIFTLEDHTGRVYGRQSVGARACSCPKRDMKREEDEEAPRGKRPVPAPAAPATPAAPTPPRSKKIRLEVRHDEPEDNDAWTVQIMKGSQMEGQVCVSARVLHTMLAVAAGMLGEQRDCALRRRLPADAVDDKLAVLARCRDKCDPGEHK